MRDKFCQTLMQGINNVYSMEVSRFAELYKIDGDRCKQIQAVTEMKDNYAATR
jgi:hypothetical protein